MENMKIYYLYSQLLLCLYMLLLACPSKAELNPPYSFTLHDQSNDKKNFYLTFKLRSNANTPINIDDLTFSLYRGESKVNDIKMFFPSPAYPVNESSIQWFMSKEMSQKISTIEHKETTAIILKIRKDLFRFEPSQYHVVIEDDSIEKKHEEWRYLIKSPALEK